MLLLILLINLHKISAPKGGTFFHRATIRTNLVQVSELMLYTNCEGFRHGGYRLDDIFFSYPYVSKCNTCDPRTGHFVSMDIV